MIETPEAKTNEELETIEANKDEDYEELKITPELHANEEKKLNLIRD